jgi:hypothetical protein
MAKKSLNLTGTAGQVYDLDKIEKETRLNAEKPLVVQVHKYTNDQAANPSELKLGQIWLSKKETSSGS